MTRCRAPQAGTALSTHGQPRTTDKLMATAQQHLALDPGLPLSERVAAVLDRLRPMLQNDGGDIDLLGVSDEGVVEVRLQGACIGCPSSTITLTLGTERNLKELVPEVTRVVCA